MSRRLVMLLMGAVLGSLASSPARAGWEFTAINVDGSADVEVYGYTNNGLITGLTYDSAGKGHGFFLKNGKMTIVDYPNAGPLGTILYQGTVGGLICGAYYDAAGISHALIYNINTKKFKVLPDIPNATLNIAGGITRSGITAGNYSFDADQDTNLGAWFFYNNKYHESVDPASDQAVYGTITQGLNDEADLVGYYLDANSVAHGFTKPLNGHYKTIDIKGADNTAAYGINNLGTIVGRYETAGTRHGFILLRDGKVTTVDYPDATQTWITAINDAGEIGGFYQDAEGNYHGWTAKDVR